MKRRKWDSKTTAKIVLEGFSRRPVSEICTEDRTYQNQYYNWRGQSLSEAHSVFGSKNKGGEVQRLRREKLELKQIREIKGDHPFWGYRRVGHIGVMMIRTMKEELLWLREWKGGAELSKDWISGLTIIIDIICIRLLVTAHRPGPKMITTKPMKKGH